ncbi:CHAD domain-containing protein [Kitasatospora sp. NBC_00240]|uniref:CHAD domain-containing protein n=1 Tax=Kitasatospora sp. NBC_00240 TaxID=2903567 RepID=UPI002254C262|nr:CHAD domain-containing protein [Kitasatospora sp. NBC_00240]MCX5208964.1 CHAD domain-containing protein [Kitasatospora sp. NBC_00240]
MPAPATTAPATTIGAVVLARLAAQAEVLAALEPAVRADEPDAVHRMRVACRRLRSALQTYRRLFAEGPARELATELKWLGAVLGQARDREVLGERLLADARALPPDCRPERTAGRLAAWFRREGDRLRPEVVAALDSTRRRALGADLAALLADPPLRGRAGRAAVPEFSRIAAREQRRTADRVRTALAAGPGPDGDTALHEARKAAKRARYAAETAEPVAGEAARRYAQRMKAVQELLGEHQDAVVAAAALRDLAAGTDPGTVTGADTGTGGDQGCADAFAYGVLYARQLAAAAAARERLPEVWARAAGRRLPRFG